MIIYIFIYLNNLRVNYKVVVNKTNEIHLQKGDTVNCTVEPSSSPVKCTIVGANKEVKACLRFLYCFNKLIKCETFEWTCREEPVVKEEDTGVVEKEHLFYSIKSDEKENKTYLCYIKNKVTAAELDKIRARINTNKKEIDKSKTETETTDIDNEDSKDQSDKGKGQKQIGKKKEEKEDSKKRIKKKPEMALRSSDESDPEENEKNKNKFNQSLVNPSKYSSSNDES